MDAASLPSSSELGVDQAKDDVLHALETDGFPQPAFTLARIDKHGRRMPQVIAHRGFNAKYPENSMRAFKAAVDAGVHALETDVHISKDGVVVLSHDADLKRCFNHPKPVTDCTWEELRQLKSTRAPHEPLARLEDLLQYLAQPAQSHLWLLLDIKLSNPVDSIIQHLAELFTRVRPLPDRPWSERVLLGCWATKFVPACHKYLPGYPVTNIGFRVRYARLFLAIPNISFNIAFPTLLRPAGRAFVREAKTQGRAVYAWTCNDIKVMDWCIRREFDGIITDDPQLLVDVMRRFDPAAASPRWRVMMILTIVRLSIMAWIFSFFFRRRYWDLLDQRTLSSRPKLRA